MLHSSSSDALSSFPEAYNQYRVESHTINSSSGKKYEEHVIHGVNARSDIAGVLNGFCKRYPGSNVWTKNAVVYSHQLRQLKIRPGAVFNNDEVDDIDHGSFYQVKVGAPRH